MTTAAPQGRCAILSTHYQPAGVSKFVYWVNPQPRKHCQPSSICNFSCVQHWQEQMPLQATELALVPVPATAAQICNHSCAAWLAAPLVLSFTPNVANLTAWAAMKSNCPSPCCSSLSTCKYLACPAQLEVCAHAEGNCCWALQSRL